MHRFFSAKFAAAVAMMFLLGRSGVAQQSWSPNGFPRGQCTWYVDGRVYEDGWLLRFSRSYGRDAGKWHWLLINGYCTDARPGTIMELGGHVAYVESVDPSSNRWTVTHANFHVGSIVRWIDGSPIYRTQFELVPGAPGKVRVVGGKTTYTLIGFIARAW